MMHILTVIGARPQIVKSLPFTLACFEHPDISETVIHTGQHYDHNMSDIFFEEFRVPSPKYKLEISGGNHGSMTGRMLIEIEKIVLDEMPDYLLVYGDTNSTVAGALAASKLNIPIIHVEAGLRAFNRKLPEEINRVITDHLSSLLFAPTELAIGNLTAEGIEQGVHKTGDIMHDSVRIARDMIEKNPERTKELMTRLDIGGPFSLSTLHRVETLGDISELQSRIEYMIEHAPSQVILPIHPGTKKRAEEMGVSLDKLKVIDPLGYVDMQILLSKADYLFTDSGGLQKEAYFHRLPCVTLRSETEWVETVDAGWNRLWNEPEVGRPKAEITSYGEGYSATEFLGIISEDFALHRP